MEAVRGDAAPDGAIRSLRTYASNLRRLLGPASDLKGEQGTHRLDLLSVETDIHRFRAVAKEAASLRDPHERSKMFGAALDLWRGPFLADLDHPWLQEESASLEWERQCAVTAWAEATIAAGRPADVISVVERAVADPSGTPSRQSSTSKRPEPECGVEISPPGAKFGAILCGQRWTPMDAGGPESRRFRSVRTSVNADGHGLEIYGSGGWVFESPRARC